jgi:hypothetical protein
MALWANMKKRNKIKQAKLQKITTKRAQYEKARKLKNSHRKQSIQQAAGAEKAATESSG